jgi:hypothetical protein
MTVALACSGYRRAEPQPLETEQRRSTGAANLPGRPQTESAAAIGSSVKLCGDPEASETLSVRLFTSTPGPVLSGSNRTG